MAESYTLVDANSGRVIVPKLALARTFWRRFCGLQFRRELAADEGLLLVPCRSIHTHWMRFPIDVVFLRRDGVVLKVLPEVRPWRMMAGVPEAYAVVETSGGAISARAEVGMRLQIAGRDLAHAVRDIFAAD
jgi:uncharacterized membrane protein (UPF0127 family)